METYLYEHPTSADNINFIKTEEPEFSFEELSDKAKEKAIESYRLEGWGTQDEWFESVYEWANDAAALIGLDIKDIYFSGFWSQGDGASFEGSYSYVKGGLKALKDEFPASYKGQNGNIVINKNNAELHKFAKALQDVQRKHFYGVKVRITKSGFYSHSNTMSFDINNEGCCYGVDISNVNQEEIKGTFRDFANWIYARLEAEYEYLNSDEQIKEAIVCNEYKFDEDGNFI